MSAFESSNSNSKQCQLLDDLSREILFFYDELSTIRTFILIRILLNNCNSTGKNLGEILLKKFCSECDESQFVIFLKVFCNQKSTLKTGIKTFQSQMEKFYEMNQNQRASEAFVKFAEDREEGLSLLDFWFENSFVRSVCLTNFELSSQVYNLFFQVFNSFCESLMNKIEQSGSDVKDIISNNKEEKNASDNALSVLGSSLGLLKMIFERIWVICERWGRNVGIEETRNNFLRKMESDKLLEVDELWKEVLIQDYRTWFQFTENFQDNEKNGQNSKSDQNLQSTAEKRIQEFPNFDLKDILGDLKIIDKGCLLLSFLKKLSLFLTSENRYENCYNFMMKIEKRMISERNPFYLALSGVLKQSLTLALGLNMGSKVRIGGNTPLNAPDMDSLQPLLVSAQNLGHLESDFVSSVFQLLEISTQPFLMLTNPNTQEVLAWVLEMRFKRILMSPESIISVKELAETTRITQWIIKKTDNEVFLQKIYLVLLRLLADTQEEQNGLSKIRVQRNMKSSLGYYLGVYDKKLIFNPNKFLGISGFSGNIFFSNNKK